MKPVRTIAVIGLFLFIVGMGCTMIAFNRAPVTTVDKDSHDAHGTNVRSFDTTISPR